MSRIILITIFLVLAAGFGYFTFIDSGVNVGDYQSEAISDQSNEIDDVPVAPSDITFYENGDSAICTVGSGSVENIYYFHEGRVRVSGAISGREINAIYKEGSVYSWAVSGEGDILSPLSFTGPTAREDNLVAFGPKDYETVCIPWLEVDKSVFVVPAADFEVINN